jgi:hypothetical protein
MRAIFARTFSDGAIDVRGKVVGIYAVLSGANVAAWAWALITFHDYPLLFGTALLAYGRFCRSGGSLIATGNGCRAKRHEGECAAEQAEAATSRHRRLHESGNLATDHSAINGQQRLLTVR